MREHCIAISCLMVCACRTPPAPELDRAGESSVASPPAAGSAPQLQGQPACAKPLDVDRLLKDLRGASGGQSSEAQINALLESAGLPKLNSSTLAVTDEAWRLADSKLQEVKIKAKGQQSLLVLRFDLGAVAFAARIALLEHEGTTRCLLSDAMSQGNFGFSCPGDNKPPIEIEPRRVVSADWDSLLVTVRSGKCDSRPGWQGADHSLQLWTYQAGELSSLMTFVTYAAHYTPPAPPLKVAKHRVEFVGDAPKEILVHSDIECRPSPLHPPKSKCMEKHFDARFSYQDGKYDVSPTSAP
ncbi:MAG: hypothetical protein R3B07_16830 [Polyangiaceae bacterium]